MSKEGKFCNSSCSATYNNKSKTEKEKEKISVSLKLYYSKNSQKHSIQQNIEKYPFSHVYYIRCIYCDNQSWTSSKRKTCGSKCFSLFQSERASKWLSDPVNRQNMGRGKRSYIEKSFENFLNTHKIAYETEMPFRKVNGYHYYVDFLFEKLKIIIELDGSQHKLTIEQDRIRDIYVSSFGYKIIRITAKEYLNGSRIQEICKILKINLC